jgi:hypothetical protein
VFTVKKNQPKLYAACKELPWSQVLARRVTSRGNGPRVTGHHQGPHHPAVDRAPRRHPGHPGLQNCHQEGKEDRRGRPPHHLRRHPSRVPDDPGCVGPGPLAQPEPAPLGQGRDLRRRPLPGPHRRRTTGHGDDAEPRDQPAPNRRLDQHRPRTATSRRRQPTPPDAPHNMISHFTEAPDPERVQRATGDDHRRRAHPDLTTVMGIRRGEPHLQEIPRRDRTPTQE